MVINIARKHEVTSKMAKQREQLKNFVVRHCVGGNKLKKVTGINLSFGVCQGTDIWSACRLERNSIDSKLIMFVIMSQTGASKFFEI